MKLSISIALFLLPFGFLFAQDYNKKNKYGQYTGEWAEYYMEGPLKHITHYTPLEFRLDTFLLPNAFSEIPDTLISPHTDYLKTEFGYRAITQIDIRTSHRDWTKIFEYDPNWQLKRILHFDTVRMYLYGSNQEIGVINHEFGVEGYVGNSYQIALAVKNLSKNNIPLRFENLPENMSSKDTLLVPANSDYEVVLNVSPEAVRHTYTLDLIGQNIKIELTLKTEGYHFKTSDFNEGNSIVVAQPDIVIKRENSESLLTIRESTSGNVVKRTSLSHDLTPLDLRGVPKGDYDFEIRDFSENTKTVKKVVLK